MEAYKDEELKTSERAYEDEVKIVNKKENEDEDVDKKRWRSLRLINNWKIIKMKKKNEFEALSISEIEDRVEFMEIGKGMDK